MRFPSVGTALLLASPFLAMAIPLPVDIGAVDNLSTAGEKVTSGLPQPGDAGKLADELPRPSGLPAPRVPRGYKGPSPAAAGTAPSPSGADSSLPTPQGVPSATLPRTRRQTIPGLDDLNVDLGLGDLLGNGNGPIPKRALPKVDNLVGAAGAPPAPVPEVSTGDLGLDQDIDIDQLLGEATGAIPRRALPKTDDLVGVAGAAPHVDGLSTGKVGDVDTEGVTTLLGSL